MTRAYRRFSRNYCNASSGSRFQSKAWLETRGMTGTSLMDPNETKAWETHRFARFRYDNKYIYIYIYIYTVYIRGELWRHAPWWTCQFDPNCKLPQCNCNAQSCASICQWHVLKWYKKLVWACRSPLRILQTVALAATGQKVSEHHRNKSILPWKGEQKGFKKQTYIKHHKQTQKAKQCKRRVYSIHIV